MSPMSHEKMAEMTAREYALAKNAETIERAAKEGWTFWTSYPEDEAYWTEQAEKYGTRTGADLYRRDLISGYSDLYKELHGIRPRWVPFETMTLVDIEALSDALYKESDERNKPEPEPVVEEPAPLTFNPFASLRLGGS